MYNSLHREINITQNLNKIMTSYELCLLLIVIFCTVKLMKIERLIYNLLF